jgi:hypothetical protein
VRMWLVLPVLAPSPRLARIACSGVLARMEQDPTAVAPSGRALLCVVHGLANYFCWCVVVCARVCGYLLLVCVYARS